jgi:hypothetical protein
MIHSMILAIVLGARPIQDSAENITRPKWITATWSANDPFAGAWNEYAQVLKKNPGYIENSGWAEKARIAINSLGSKASAKSLYRAAACYLAASDLDWRFDRGPWQHNVAQRANSSVLWGKLFNAWISFAIDLHSKEFCRVGFAVCCPSFGPSLEAGNMPRALLKEFPDDRIVVSSLVWYSRTPNKPNTWEWRTWVLDQAKRLPALPGARPQDYLTLATAYFARHWAKDTLSDAIGYRDNLLEFRKRVPSEFGALFGKSVESVNSQIKKLGG